MRNHTPPYITAQPDVIHRRLGGPARGLRFLILASDGFADLCSGKGQERIVLNWAKSMADQPFEARKSAKRPDNMALRLLRQALGGDDRYSVSRVLTLNMDVAWIDDTSIVVQTL